jgi:hypothetical protein
LLLLSDQYDLRLDLLFGGFLGLVKHRDLV